MLHQPKVLIADDDVGLLTALAVRLRAAGYAVRTAQDCYQAVQLANRWRPDVIVLDLRMPAGDGCIVQDRIESSRKGLLRVAPVIFLTGERSAQVDAMSACGRAFAVLHKPCDTQTLIGVIEDALHRSPVSTVID
ncbi:MAG: hypothetical protein RJA16_998 [Planctomycetota bacterium]